MQLYKLSAELAIIATMLETAPDTGETTDGDGVVWTREDLERHRALLMEKGDALLDDLACATTNYEAEADALKEEAARLGKRAQRAEARAKWMRDTIKGYMERHGLIRVKGPHFTVALGKPLTRVEVADPAKLPEEYLHPAEARRPDLAKVKAAMTAGADVPGAQFVEGARPLRIT